MDKRLLTRVWILALLISSGCGVIQPPIAAPSPFPTTRPAEPGPTSGPAPVDRLPVLFDDDGSPDGTTALLYILSHPAADLKSASISYGETHPEVYIQHVGRLMDAAGFAGIPLGYGQDAPMAGHNEFPEGIRQAGNDFWGLPIPNADKTYPAQTAPALMVATIKQSAAPVTIFVSGPATNLAQALQLDPGIKSNIAAVYMMGGAVYVRGNIDDLVSDSDNRVAEWNIFGDPQAASIALEAGLDFRFVPLDATNLVLVTAQDINQWRQGGPAADQAADIYDMVLGYQGGQQAAIWDLMTAAIMLDPDLCGFQRLRLEIVTQDGNTSGQTAVVPGGEPNASVCLTPDGAGIRQRLLDVFSGNAVSTPPAATPAAPAGRGAPATASAELPDGPAGQAVDGNLATAWNSGQDAEQWILLDLGAPQALTRLRLHVAQDPAGTTRHQVWVGGDPGNLTLVQEFQGYTSDRGILDFMPPSPLADIRFVKVITLQSPSWVAWREIEVSSE